MSCGGAIGHTDVPKDLPASSGEFVLGAPLCGPGQCLQASPPHSNCSQFLERQRSTVRAFRPILAGQHGRHPVFWPAALDSGQFVFMQRDGHRTPLQRPYDGPFRVLRRTDKNFLLDIVTRRDHVSVDHLKPAVIDPSAPVPPPEIIVKDARASTLHFSS